MIQRKIYEWRPRSHKFLLGERTLISGLLHLAPDGPDEGHFADPDRAFARGLEMQENGAGMIELAGEHFRSGVKPVSDAEEIRRVIPVLKRLRESVDLPIVIRTWKSAVAEKALSLGAAALHDVSGLTWNPDLAKLAVQYDAGLILNHMRGTPDAWGAPPAVKDMMEQLVTGLGAAAHRANRANVDRQRTVLDAGFGMGKRREHNLEILAGLVRLGALGVPVSVALSDEPFMARGEEKDSPSTYGGVVTAALLSGAHIVTLSDVAGLRQTVQLADALLTSQAQTPEAPVKPSARTTGARGDSRAGVGLASRTKMRPPLRD